MRALKIIFGIAAVVFLLLPIVAILPLAFTDSVFLNYPIPGVSLRWFDQLASGAWQRSIINSLIIGGGATLVLSLIHI